jgi:hypothetical protein
MTPEERWEYIDRENARYAEQRRQGFIDYLIETEEFRNRIEAICRRQERRDEEQKRLHELMKKQWNEPHKESFREYANPELDARIDALLLRISHLCK